ncbi:MAG: HAD-IIB family hydrolase, partial [SAR324 cluster bacterium]|nr:HAD-IIB family hydrolase [SAR324 cluster bacterium]
MQPLIDFSKIDLRKIRFVLTDIDDTLTENGRLPAKSYQALESLQQSGLKVIPITGRPAGWCDHIARMWPVDGVVGENGAFYFTYDSVRKKIKQRFWKDENQRASDRKRLAQLRKIILAEVEGCAVASDQAYREADLAIDFCEDVPALSKSTVAQIVDIFEQAGAIAKVSSIHVNGWFGDYDKLSMTRILLAECFQTEMDSAQDQIVFCGDSPNDEPMFGFFENSVGVANVLD